MTTPTLPAHLQAHECLAVSAWAHAWLAFIVARQMGSALEAMGAWANAEYALLECTCDAADRFVRQDMLDESERIRHLVEA